jgi:hypothetical protein
MSNSKVKRLGIVSISQGDYTKTVAENKQEFYQDIIDERFTYATDYKVIQEQVANGGTTYQDVGVRVTHAISSGLTENFAKETKKIIFQTYDHPQELGKMYKFDDFTWITVNSNEITSASSHSIVRKCNNILKWVDAIDSTKLYQWECVFTKQFTGTNFDDGNKGVPQIAGQFWVIVQQNAQTNLIKFNQRFMFDGHTFQVIQIDNHLSKTYMTLKLKEIDIQANDNVDDNISNDTNLTPSGTETKILPQVVKILQSASQAYTIYKYVNGVANSNTFTITGSQAPSANYTLTIVDGNHFTITNIAQTPITLIIRCVNNVTAEETELEIVLGGVW